MSANSATRARAGSGVAGCDGSKGLSAAAGAKVMAVSALAKRESGAVSRGPHARPTRCQMQNTWSAKHATPRPEGPRTTRSPLPVSRATNARYTVVPAAEGVNMRGHPREVGPHARPSEWPLLMTPRTWRPASHGSRARVYPMQPRTFNTFRYGFSSGLSAR
jgi:hypothetical protein